MNGEEIRALRLRLGMTQFEFAQAVGVQVSTVSTWENNSVRISNLAERAVRALEAGGEGAAG